MPLNRFMHPVSKDYSWSSYQPIQWEPNYDAWLETLDKQQALYDTKNNILVPEHLQEDAPYIKNQVSNIESMTNAATDAYVSGDVSAGNRLLREAQRKQVELWRPGGIFSTAKQKYTDYNTFKAKQQERLEKGDITQEQYLQSVQGPLTAYGKQGGLEKNAQLNLLSREQAVDPDKFLQDYLKNYESDLEQSGYKLTRENGKLVYRKSETEKIDYDKVLSDSKLALKNAMNQTGQLNDWFDVRTKDSQFSMQPFVEDYQKRLSSQADVKNKLETLSNKELIKYFNEKGIGANDKNIAALKERALTQVNAQIENINSKLKDIGSITSPEDIKSFNKDYLIDQYLSNITKPYASAKSFEKKKTFQDVYSDPYVDFSLDKELAKFKKDLDNPYIPPTSGYTEAFVNPLLGDIDKLTVGKDGKLAPETRVKTSYPNANKPITGISSVYEASTPTNIIDNVSEKENELYKQVKESYKNLYNTDLTDRQAVDLYNQMLEKTKSQSIVFERFNDDKEREAVTKRTLGNEKKIINAGSRPVYIVTGNGEISQPLTAQQANATLGNKGKDVTLDKGIEGKISARNPLGLPTGDYGTIADSQGNVITVIIGNRSIEEDRHFSRVNKLAKPTFSLETEFIPITDEYGRETGERFMSEPIPIIKQVNGKPVFEGTDARITKLDAYGNPVEIAPGIQSMSLTDYEKLTRETNPYKQKTDAGN